jgi:pimeloyl-ACP methyl ester carboxylesterase
VHVSTYFGAVVRTGMTTMHVWDPMRSHVSADEIRRFWSPISPYPYLQRLSGSGQKLLMISGRYDPTFWPEFTEEMFSRITNDGVDVEIVRLPCGHYSLDRPPFSFIAGLRFGFFLRDRLI